MISHSDPSLKNAEPVLLSDLFHQYGLMPTAYTIDNSALDNNKFDDLVGQILRADNIPMDTKTVMIMMLSRSMDDQERLRKMSWKVREADVREARLVIEKEALERVAYFDELTKVRNRAGFLRELNGELEKFADASNVGRRRTDGAAVIIVDLRKFKPINDEFGHDAGDTALKLVASELEKVVRDEDVVGRWGGDEFVVMVRNIKSAESQKVLQRLEERLEQFSFDYDGTVIGFSARMGKADIGPNQNAVEVMHAADMVMINSKDPDERGGPAMVLGAGKPQPK